MIIQKKVLQLTPHFYWPQLEATGWSVKFDTMGGMQNQIYRQMNRLAQLEVRQILVTYKVPRTPRSCRLREGLEAHCVRIPVFPVKSKIRGMMDLNLSWMLGVLWFTCRHRAKLKQEVGVLHTHCSGVGLPLLTGRLVSKLLSKPLVLTIHCSALVTYKPMNLLDVFLHKLNKRIETYVLRHADKCLFLTQRTYNACKTAVPSLVCKHAIVPDSIDTQAFCQPSNDARASEFRRQYDLPTEKFICVYVGRIAREKGWRDLLRIASALDSTFHFLIIGDGNEFQVMRRHLAKMKLQNRFTLTGYVSQEIVPVGLAVSDVLLLPSHHEEFGSILLEAMSCRIPTIARDVGGVKQVLAHEETGFLVNDVEGFVRTIKTLKKSPHLRAQVAGAAYRHVNKNYQLDAAVQKLVDVYKEFVS